jgi:A/G-specific adenine glycosylase
MYNEQIDALKQWFIQVKRVFPWRKDPTPYAVWISEVMLQQTRASVVISYFTSFMQKFPTVQALAKAPIEEIFKVWEGLGYYSRARNLKEAALDLV